MTKKKLFNQKNAGVKTVVIPGKTSDKSILFKFGLIALTWVIGAVMIFKIVTVFAADVYFARGTSQGDITALKQATVLNGDEEAYHRNLGLGYAIAAKSETDATLQNEVAAAADAQFKTAIDLNNQNLLTLKAAIIGYEQLGKIDTSYLKEAERIASILIKLSPTDPSLWYEAAKVAAALGNKPLANSYYEKTLSLKNDLTLFPAL
jgi:hypothetical protein